VESILAVGILVAIGSRRRLVGAEVVHAVEAFYAVIIHAAGLAHLGIGLALACSFVAVVSVRAV